MSGHRAAPGGKLDAQSVAIIRRYGPDAAVKKGVPVTRRQILRVAKGQSWANGWLPPQADDIGETKQCAVCGQTFGRRFPSGRTRSDRLWAQKETCGNACNTKKFWAQGVFADRPRPAKRHDAEP